jgi:hypothetical protein
MYKTKQIANHLVNATSLLAIIRLMYVETNNARLLFYT